MESLVILAASVFKISSGKQINSGEHPTHVTAWAKLISAMSEHHKDPMVMALNMIEAVVKVYFLTQELF